ncbi:SDR family NAD(P)-dependent oxidoreductase [Natronorarus salvus]|uniref:SDR family NAD(P)-dependent oxidoreductase n=1 Tax=Natronorarus salvus TaxID=3117733 RepID=UPI002F260CD5
MSVSFDFSDRVVLVTGACGALGSAVCEAFSEAGATVAASDVVEVDSEDSLLDPDLVSFYQADFTDEERVAEAVDAVAADHGGIDHLCAVAGTWRGGQPVAETDLSEYELLMNVNLKTAFLAAKHALPHLQEREGTLVAVSAKSGLEGGSGDGPYRVTKAGIRLLVETIAEENVGTVRANCVMPSVIDTPMNRDMMPDADHSAWVDPAEIARTFLALSSDATPVTSGAAVPVYGEKR